MMSRQFNAPTHVQTLLIDAYTLLQHYQGRIVAADLPLRESWRLA